MTFACSWRIELLGGLRVRCDNQETRRFRTVKAGGVLGYLALQKGALCPRERLAELFWPEMDTKAARHNLREALSLLRRQLGSPKCPPEHLIGSSNTSVWLRSEAFTTDVADLEAAFRAANAAADLDSRITSLETVVRLHQGELLPNVYDNWVLKERHYFEGIYKQALRLLTTCLITKGIFGEATRYALRAFLEEPDDAEGYNNLRQLLGEQQKGAEVDAKLQSIIRDLEGGKPAAARRKARKYLQTELQETIARQNVDARLPSSVATPSAAASQLYIVPVPLNRLVGRLDDIVSVASMLSDSGRLVTLIGSGGIGKTRLSIEVARHVKSGYDIVAFVPLADISDPQMLTAAIASVLRLPPPSGQSLFQQVSDFFQGGRALLILDNFEHIVRDAIPVVAALLRQVPTLQCLVTSRRRLAIDGEYSFEVQPLSLPDIETDDRISDCDSVELFLQRAREVRFDFAVTARNAAAMNALCRVLEGIPLAIELAAARIGTISLPEMVQQLSDRSALLNLEQKGGEDRHRSLRVVLDWSLALLPSPVRQLLLSLSVFQGGWTAEAAGQVCEQPAACDYLEILRIFSLISAEEEQGNEPLPMRFRMLETVREYGRMQLTPGECHKLAMAHADYFYQLCPQTPAGTAREALYATLDREYNNVRAALEWYSANDRVAQKGLGLAVAIGEYWFYRGHYVEQRHWLEKLLNYGAGDSHEYDYLRGKALYHAGRAAQMLVDMDAALALFRAAESMFIAGNDPGMLGVTLNKLGLVAQAHGDYEAARDYFERGGELCQKAGVIDGVAHMHKCLGSLQLRQGDYAGGRESFERALALYRQLDGFENGACMMMTELGGVAALEGRLDVAEALLAESLEVARKRGFAMQIGNGLSYLARTAESSGNGKRAIALLEEAQEVFRKMGNRPVVEALAARIKKLKDAEIDKSKALG